MYDLSQFRAALYLLLAIGISGFAVAADEPGLWVFAISLLVINAWLIHTGRFVPLPRLLAAALTVGALIYISMEIYWEITNGGAPPILIIGEFLVLLHLVKLYEQRANRDYAQMLVLSLLLMAASSISTASVLFGALLMIYLLISLYCSLLFHLKVEADAAKALLGRQQEHVNPAVLRQDQRRLSGSMRRLTGLVSIFSVVMAVAVFLFFPRYTAQGLMGHQFFTAQQVLGGFNEEVSLDHVVRIEQSEAVMAQVKVTQNGKPWGGTQPLLLRGTTLDRYTGPAQSDPEAKEQLPPWHWVRSEQEGDDASRDISAGYGAKEATFFEPESEQDYLQDVTLQPSDTHVVFAMAGISALEFPEGFKGRLYRRDGVVMGNQAVSEGGMLCYQIWSSGRIPRKVTPPRVVSYIDPALAAFARRPEVSGRDDAGQPLAGDVGTPGAPADINRRVAQAMQGYLRANYKYTTDLTAESDIFSREDPMVAFLVDVKAGHCEYFAGAMTLMCQSLGIPARMVVGYRSDEFNEMGQYYTVRRSHAHAWVEVLNGDHWETYDPTSATELMTTAKAGWFGKMRDLFNYLDYTWGTAVVAYGQENRKNLLASTENGFVNAVDRTTDHRHGVPALLHNFPAFLDWLALHIAGWALYYPSLIGDVMLLMGLSIVVLVIYYFYSQFRLRQRAMRIGLAGLPGGQRRQLARQLGFYDDLLRLLEKRGIAPPPQLTPLEFSRQLDFLPHQAYSDIRRLTRLFYRIRYGGAVLNSDRHRRLAQAIARLEGILGMKKVRKIWQ